MSLIVAGVSPMVLANSLFLLVYAFLLWDKFPKVVVVLLGAMAAVLLGVLTQQQAFAYVDWNVIFLLVGMMLIVACLKQTGVFDWLGFRLIKAVKGNAILLFWSLCLTTAFFSAGLDNVTTILFMGSLTCTLAKRLQFSPVPWLIAQVMASNIGGAATLVGDPPNIMIASAAGLSFNDFLVHITPVVLLILPLSIALLHWLYRKHITFTPEQQQAIANFSTEGLITNKPLLLKTLVVTGMVLAAFLLHSTLHLEVGTIALTGAAVLMLFTESKALWNEVEWDSIFFFIGLFMVVGAVEHVGTLKLLASGLFTLASGNFKTLSLVVLWGSGLLSAIIDNIPYTATMLPLIQNLGSHFNDIKPLWWALALGACLGGNGSLIGATANVVAAELVQHHSNERLRFSEFLKAGALVTLLSLGVSTAYVALRYW